MKLVRPTQADLNAAYHTFILKHGKHRPVRDYCMGDDRQSVYGELARRHGKDSLKMRSYPDAKGEWLVFEIALGDQPWIGTGRTLLEAVVNVMLVAAGVEVER